MDVRSLELYGNVPRLGKGGDAGSEIPDECLPSLQDRLANSSGQCLVVPRKIVREYRLVE